MPRVKRSTERIAGDENRRENMVGLNCMRWKYRGARTTVTAAQLQPVAEAFPPSMDFMPISRTG
ncbi:hypothetical protein KCP69_03420 [Salmonella enterica subsp. enterica]|nr:hypothetical protein KCP69_03420 [Salmonella enterica subsp. enterica]